MTGNGDGWRGDVTDAATNLAREVSKLNDDLGAVSRRASMLGKILAVAFSGLILDIAVSAGLGLGYYNQNATNARVSNLLQQQCSVLSLYLGSYAPQTRAPGVGRQQYEDAFNSLRDSYHALACTTPIVPPRTDTPPPK